MILQTQKILDLMLFFVIYDNKLISLDLHLLAGQKKQSEDTKCRKYSAVLPPRLQPESTFSVLLRRLN